MNINVSFSIILDNIKGQCTFSDVVVLDNAIADLSELSVILGMAPGKVPVDMFRPIESYARSTSLITNHPKIVSYVTANNVEEDSKELLDVSCRALLNKSVEPGYVSTVYYMYRLINDITFDTAMELEGTLTYLIELRNAYEK